MPRRMPAEWQAHDATWVAWPHNPETWPDCLSEAENEFAFMVETISRGERVEVLVQSAEHEREIAARLRDRVDPERVCLHVFETDDVWLRDIGPSFVWSDEPAGITAVDWVFNAWGRKYPPWDRDDSLAAYIAGICGVTQLRPELVCEGGALEVDGEGTLLATRSTLLDERRNSDLDPAELAALLEDLLGITHIVWLGEGIEGDDTDGHIDDIARFVTPGRVVCAREPDRGSANHEPLEECRATLLGARDAAGRKLEVIELPMPPRLEADGEPLPASYANFYVFNGHVAVPIFGAASDEVALGRLRPLFPDRQLIGVPSRTLIRGLGAVHCLTQQQPSPRR